MISFLLAPGARCPRSGLEFCCLLSQEGCSRLLEVWQLREVCTIHVGESFQRGKQPANEMILYYILYNILYYLYYITYSTHLDADIWAVFPTCLRCSFAANQRIRWLLLRIRKRLSKKWRLLVQSGFVCT